MWTLPGKDVTLGEALCGWDSHWRSWQLNSIYHNPPSIWDPKSYTKGGVSERFFTVASKLLNLVILCFTLMCKSQSFILQGTSNCNPKPHLAWFTVCFLSTDVFKQNHAHLFLYCLWLFCHRQNWAIATKTLPPTKPKIFTIWLFTEKNSR